MLYRITYIDYTSDENGVYARVGGRDHEGNRRVYNVRGVKPTMYVPDTEAIPRLSDIQTTESGYTSYDGTPLTKLTLSNPRKTSSVEKEFSEVYESDLPFYRKLATRDGLIGHVDIPGYKNTVHIDEVDSNPDFENPIIPRVCIGDIEILPGNESIDDLLENANQPVTAVTFWDSYTNKYTVIVLDEERDVDANSVNDHIRGHWDDEYHDDYVDCAKTLIRCNSDEEMKSEILSYLTGMRFDVIGGWNWVDFDWLYLMKWLQGATGWWSIGDIGTPGNIKAAEERNMMERVIPGLPAFDMMNAFTKKMSFSNWRSKALDYVSEVELGIGKVEDIDVEETYYDDRSRLVAYNVIDVQLLVALERKNEIYNFFFGLADLSSIPIYDTFSELRLVDGYVLSRRTDDEILPSVTEKDAVENAGGLVLDSEEGVEDWVGVFDLTSLYPSAIVTCNISPETMGGNDVTVPNMPANANEAGGVITQESIDWDEPMATFGFEQEGIVPKYVKQLFVNRNEYKSQRNEHDPGTNEYELYDQRQASIKVIMNSFYGVASSPYWRLSVEGLGDAVTGAGRYVLWQGARLMEDNDYRILAGDTDSVIVQLTDGDSPPVESVVDIGRTIETELNERMELAAINMGITDRHPYLVDGDLHGTEYHTFVWEFEKLYRRYLGSGRKKRYAGNIVWKEGNIVDDIHITGFESRRSDVSEISAETQTRVLQRILDGKSFDDISEYVQRQIGEMEHEFDTQRHGLPSVINKPVEEYPNRPMKRAVNYSNEYLGYDWGPGDNPWLVYISASAPDKGTTDIIAIGWRDDIPEGFVVNNRKMIQRNIRQPLESIFDIVGWDWRAVKSGKRAQSLMPDDSSNVFSAGKNRDTGPSDNLRGW